MMRSLRWGDIATLRYGKGLRDYPSTPSETHSVQVFGTNGPIGWNNKPLVNSPGIIVGRKGAYRGVHYSPAPFYVIDTAYYLDITDAEVDLKWAYYKLLTVDINRMDSGSAIPSTCRNDFEALYVHVPTKTAQLRIADILSTYDDLIENNLRRMELLEASARHLFEEWFVRLCFPGREHTKITNGVPEGWEVMQLQSITTKIGSGFTPRGGQESYLDHGIPLIRSLNVYDDRFQDNGLAFLSDEQATELRNVTVEPRDILLNITGASVARCCMAPQRHLPARVNQHVMIIRVNPSLADPFFVHKAINSDERKRQLLSFAQKGSTREALTKEMVSTFQIVLPPTAIMQQYGEFAKDCFEQSEILARQCQRLKTARDLLLPRLMSGEVPV